MKTMEYEYVILEGSHYEVGKQRGEYLKKNLKDLNYYREPFFYSGNTLSKSKINDIKILYQEYYPEILSEVAGFADAIGVAEDSVIYRAHMYENYGGCCHMAVGAEFTANHHVLVGRSYEYSLEDERKLTWCRISGKPAHLGFAVYLFGRYEGINEYGLSITVSNSTPGVTPEADGIRFWVAVRMLIENCENTRQAVELLKDIPVSANNNFIIADKSGDIVLAESACFGGKRMMKFKQIEEFVVSTNHYAIQEMEPYNRNKMNQSVMRYDVADETLRNCVPNVDETIVKRILSEKVPNGVCCHQYEDGLGTLYSMFMDLNSMEIKVCLGSPNINKWYKIDLFSNKSGSWNIQIPYINEYPQNPSYFWEKCK